PDRPQRIPAPFIRACTTCMHPSSATLLRGRRLPLARMRHPSDQRTAGDEIVELEESRRGSRVQIPSCGSPPEKGTAQRMDNTLSETTLLPRCHSRGDRLSNTHGVARV